MWSCQSPLYRAPLDGRLSCRAAATAGPPCAPPRVSPPSSPRPRPGSRCWVGSPLFRAPLTASPPVLQGPWQPWCSPAHPLRAPPREPPVRASVAANPPPVTWPSPSRWLLGRHPHHPQLHIRGCQSTSRRGRARPSPVSAPPVTPAPTAPAPPLHPSPLVALRTPASGVVQPAQASEDAEHRWRRPPPGPSDAEGGGTPK